MPVKVKPCPCGCGQIIPHEIGIVSHHKSTKKGKWCSYCWTFKSKDDFAKSKYTKDGRQYGCKQCRSLLTCDWQKENPDKVNEKNRVWYHTDGNGVRAQKQKIANNPELYRMIGRKRSQTRRARMRNAFVEYVDPQIVFERDEAICQLCLEPIEPGEKWELDHIVPLSKGGSHTEANTQIAHLECNRVKGKDTLDVLVMGVPRS